MWKAKPAMGLFDYPTEPEQGVSGPLAPELGGRTFTFMEGASEQDWKKILSLVETRHFRAGEDLVSLGEIDDSFYILTSGTVEVMIPDRKGVLQPRAIIPEGSVFGEIAFFDAGPRSGTIRAREAGTAIRVTRKTFDHLAAWEPTLARQILLNLGKILAARLRAATRA